MKVVINSCFGGFGLSPKAMKRIAELQGRECFAFDRKLERIMGSYKARYIPVDFKNERASYFFDVPNPDEVIGDDKIRSNHQYYLHNIDDFEQDRSNPLLVQVVEELGKEANGEYAKLKIVEIPDDTDFIIQEYDGNEWIAERHRTWQ